MAVELIWRIRAENHLQSIFDYISAGNADAAEAYVEAIVEACDRLRSFPLSGRAFDKRHRVLVMRNHLVFYRYERESAKVIIVAILDGRRDVDVLLHDIDSDERSNH